MQQWSVHKAAKLGKLLLAEQRFQHFWKRSWWWASTWRNVAASLGCCPQNLSSAHWFVKQCLHNQRCTSPNVTSPSLGRLLRLLTWLTSSYSHRGFFVLLFLNANQCTNHIILLAPISYLYIKLSINFHMENICRTTWKQKQTGKLCVSMFQY